MHFFLLLLSSLIFCVGCTSQKLIGNNKPVNRSSKDSYRPDNNSINNNLVFMLGKQSRFELEVQEDNRKFGQLFKVGLNESKSSVNNQYRNNEYSTMKPIQKISFTMPVPEPIWNEKKQTVEFKWIQKPHYTFDAY
ncbi:hypothetical protein WMR86_07790 [Proteus vulgaris]